MNDSIQSYSVIIRGPLGVGKTTIAAVHYLVSRVDYGTSIDTTDKTAEDVLEEMIALLPIQSPTGEQA